MTLLRPIRRTGNFSPVELGLELARTSIEKITRREPGALLRNPGADLTPARARREIDVRFLVGDSFDAPLDPNLTLDLLPQDGERRPRRSGGSSAFRLVRFVKKLNPRESYAFRRTMRAEGRPSGPTVATVMAFGFGDTRRSRLREPCAELYGSDPSQQTRDGALSWSRPSSKGGNVLVHRRRDYLSTTPIVSIGSGESGDRRLPDAWAREHHAIGEHEVRCGKESDGDEIRHHNWEPCTTHEDLHGDYVPARRHEPRGEVVPHEHSYRLRPHPLRFGQTTSSTYAR